MPKSRSPCALLTLLTAVLGGVLVALTAAAAETGQSVDFSLKDLDGKVHTLSEYRGKWVVVNFWATTCPPCIKEMPELSDFHDRHKDRDAVVLGMNFEDIKPSWMRRFLDSVHVSYPILPWGTAPATPFGLVVALPTTYIVTPEGKTVAQQVGPMTAADIEAYIQRKTEAGQTDEPAMEHEAQQIE